MNTPRSTNTQRDHSRTMAALPLPSEEILTPRRQASQDRGDQETYQIRLTTFRRAIVNKRISVENVRALWLDWYGQDWDEVAGEAAAADQAITSEANNP